MWWLLLLCIVVCGGCSTEHGMKEAVAGSNGGHGTVTQWNAQRAKENLTYFMDERTQICFAFTWAGGGAGGPGLAEVACDKVRDFLMERGMKSE